MASVGSVRIGSKNIGIQTFTAVNTALTAVQMEA